MRRVRFTERWKLALLGRLNRLRRLCEAPGLMEAMGSQHLRFRGRLVNAYRARVWSVEALDLPEQEFGIPHKLVTYRAWDSPDHTSLLGIKFRGVDYTIELDAAQTQRLAFQLAEVE